MIRRKTTKAIFLAIFFFFAVSIQAQEAEAPEAAQTAQETETTETANEQTAEKKEAAQETELDEVVVTASREQEAKKNVAATIGVVNKNVIKDVKPTHPSEIVRRVPGVHINTTSGEGHLTAIRHPLTTSAVYLFLEDGIPTRSTGFFNHNALYEVNVPQAGGIEILKGREQRFMAATLLAGLSMCLQNL